MTWNCSSCTCEYAVGLPHCPQCGSTAKLEDAMPKTTIAGASNRWDKTEEIPLPTEEANVSETEATSDVDQAVEDTEDVAEETESVQETDTTVKAAPKSTKAAKSS